VKSRLLAVVIVLLVFGVAFLVKRTPHDQRASSSLSVVNVHPPVPSNALTSPAQAQTNVVLGQFQEWQQHYLATPANERPVLVAEGVRLARERRAEFKTLIRENPREALRRAVPMTARQGLPTEVVRELEQRVNQRADLRVYHGDPHPGETIPKDWIVYRLAAFSDGSALVANVYGRRAQDMFGARNDSLNGVAVDNQFAVNDSPVRVLEAGERPDPAKPVITVSPVSGRQLTAADAVAVEIPEAVVYLDDAQAVETFITYLYAEGGTGGPVPISGILPAAPTPAIGVLKVLFIPMTFADQNATPTTESKCYEIMRDVADFYAKSSYGKLTTLTTVSPAVKLPHNEAWYVAKDTSNGGTINCLSLEHTHAREEAKKMGFDFNDYQCTVVRLSGGPRAVGGWGSIGLVWVYSDNVTVCAHEIGHSLGLDHANYWDTASTSAIGAGANAEYDDIYDVMGSGSVPTDHFNPQSKNQIKWLPSEYVPEITRSGTYRIHAFDQPMLDPSNRYALRIVKDAQRTYWGEVRQNYNGSSSRPWADKGLLLGWRFPNGGGGNIQLIDTTPGSPYGRDDAAISIGRTFSDFEAGIHITTINVVTNPPKYADMVVNLGQFPGNQPPTLAVSASANVVPTNTTVTFTATASDPDGDALAYSWQHFGDTSLKIVSPNSNVITRTFSTAGSYVVACTVSDMKGGSRTRQQLITVGNGNSRYTIAGRVTIGGVGLANVIVTANGANGVVTDNDGFYVIPNLTANTYTMTPLLYGYTFSEVFNNNVTVGPNFTGADFEAEPVPVVTIAATVPDASETGPTTGRFTITRTGDTSQPFDVYVNAAQGTATKGTDYSFSPDYVSASQGFYTFTILAEQASLDVVVTPVDDATAEGPETVILQLGPGNNYVVGAASSATVTIADNETTLPKVSLAVTDERTIEGSSLPARVTFTRTGATTNSLTVNYTVSGTTAPGGDYTALPGNVVIPTGAASAVVEVNSIDDSVSEPVETVVITIASTPSYLAAPTAATATLSIVDDDVQMVSVSATDNSAKEVDLTVGGAQPDTGTFLIRRTGDTNQSLLVYYALSGPTTAATALHGTDYEPLAGSVVIPAGASSATVTILPRYDSLGEGREYVTLQLGAGPTDYRLGTNNSATVTIDDAATDVPYVEVIGTANPSEPSTAGNFRFSVKSSGASTVTVNYAVSGTATAGADYTIAGLDTNTLTGSINIPLNNSTAVTNLAVMTINDALAEDLETITLTISSNAAYQTFSPSSSATLWMYDDEQPTVYVDAHSTSYPPSMSETNSAISFYISRTGSTASPLTVNFSLGGTAVNGVDYNIASNTVVIAAGSSGVDVTITPVNDSTFKGTRTIVLTLDPGAYGCGPAATMYLTDNETSNLWVGFSSAGASGPESVGAVNIPVTLTSTASTPVTVEYVVSSGSRSSATAVNPISLPYWVRVVRNGSWFSSFISTDGVTWTNRGSMQAISMSNASYFAGIAVASATNGIACTGMVDNVSITGLDLGGSAGTLTNLDIGSPSPAGANSETGGVHTITAGGPDISSTGTLDAFRYVYFPISNSSNCTLTARVLSMSGGTTNSKAGVMFRETTANNARHFSATAARNGTTRVIYRTSTGGSAANSASTAIARPYWVRLQRSGDAFAGFASPDGTTWTQVGAQTMALATEVFAGLAVSAKTDLMVCTAAFDNVTLTGSPPLQGRTVGFVNTQGTDSVTGGVYTVTAAGNGVGGSEDECHFVAATVNGDFTLTARVLTQAGSATAAQAGVMARETLSYRARSVYMGSVANAGVEFIQRDDTVTTAFGVGVDYTLSAGTLTFNPGDTVQNIPLTIINDTTPEWDEQITVTLRNAYGAQLGWTTFTYTVMDDDQPPALPSVGFAATNTVAAENSGMASVLVALSTPSASTVTVDYAVSGGTATPGADFNLPAGTVTFAPGETVQSFGVALLDDTAVETNETVIISLSNPSGAVLGSLNQHTLTITDDDFPVVTVVATDPDAAESGDTGMFTFTRTGSVASNLVVNFSRSGTASSGSDFSALPTSVTIPAAQSSTNLTVTPQQDASNEGNETVILTLSANANYTIGSPSSATVTIADDDRSTVSIVASIPTASEMPGNPGQFTLTRTTPTNSSLTVNLSITGTASINVDYTNMPVNVTFAAGQANVTVNVYPVDDALTEGPEQVVVQIASGSYYIDTNSFASVTIADNDSPPSLLITSPTAQGPLIASGHGLIVSATVTDDGAPQPVTLAWSQDSGPGTATFESPTAATSAVTFSTNGTYVLKVTATDGQFTVNDQVTVVVGPAITPSDWIVEDMTPAVSIRGQTLLLNNVFTLTGTGAGYSNMTADAAHVMVRQVAGDGSVVARLNSLTGPTNRLAGVTIRDTLYRSATRAVLGYVPGSGLQFRTRTTVSATDSVTNQTGVTLPVWLRLDRNAATGAISAFYAPDVSGSPGTWNPVGVATVVTMDTNAVFGLTATSSSASSSAAATFDNVALTPDGDALITEDFGTSSPVAGTDGYTNGVYTIGGSGLLDSSGHFVGRPYVGDFVATVKLVNATSVATSAKSGLMIRESMDGGGYIFLGRIPTGSFDGYIWRTLAAGSSSGVPSFTASTRWIRLIRNGNKTTGFHAPDVSGAPGAWVQLGQPRTVIMTTPVLVGLAVDNAGGTGLNTCTFSNLTVVSLNKAPIVNPGTVAPYPLSPFALNGSVTDDSYPTPPAVTLLWSQRAGPGTVTFADATLTNTTASVSVSGDYTLRLQADDGSVQTFRDLTFTAYATAYDAWAGQQWAGTGGINDPNSISTADPDGDGIANLMEYALNLDPNVPGVIGLPVQGTTNVGGNDYLTLTYTRVKSATDISYVVEVSGDLVTWNSGPSYTATVSVTDNPDGITQTVVVRDLVPMGSATSRFIRLKITQP